MSNELMQQVSVRFLDDETVEGRARNLSFDEPDFLLDIDHHDRTENNETAWIPLSSIKLVEFLLEPEGARESATRKVAIRFLDGEVLKGYIGGALDRHRYGVQLVLHPEEPTQSIRRLGIPFSAVKALFFLREFDGRPLEDKGMPSEAYLARRTMAPLLEVLEEMDMLGRLHADGVLTDSEFEAKRAQVLERI